MYELRIEINTKISNLCTEINASNFELRTEIDIMSMTQVRWQNRIRIWVLKIRP